MEGWRRGHGKAQFKPRGSVLEAPSCHCPHPSFCVVSGRQRTGAADLDGVFEAAVPQPSFAHAQPAVCNVVIYERFPRWLRREIGEFHHARGSDVSERQALLDGLDELVAVLRRGERRKAA